MNESVVTDDVGTILRAMISYCKIQMNYEDLIWSREKHIISKDEQVSANMEFLVIQKIDVHNTRYIIGVEAKRETLGKVLYYYYQD